MRLLAVSQVCAFKDQTAKHQILSRSSSEPSQRVGSADQCLAEENDDDQTSTDDPGDNHTDTHANEDAREQNAASATRVRRESTGRDTVIKDTIQGQEETETSGQKREDEEGNKKKDKSSEPTERERERPTLRWSSSDHLFSSISLTVFVVCFLPVIVHSFVPVSNEWHEGFPFPKVTQSHTASLHSCDLYHIHSASLLSRATHLSKRSKHAREGPNKHNIKLPYAILIPNVSLSPQKTNCASKKKGLRSEQNNADLKTIINQF